MTTTSAISWGQVELVDQETYDKGKALLGRLCKAALETAKKIWNFIKRHKKEIFIYSLLGASLLVVGVSFPKMAMVVLPGLAYMLAFSDGAVLPSDVLDYFKSNRDTGVWLPKTPEEVENRPTLLKRIEIKTKIEYRIHLELGKGWNIIKGESGAGKTAFLLELGRQLAEKGHPVYLLDTTSLKNGTVNGHHDTRWLALATHLNAVALLSDKEPILLIDELTSVFNTSSSAFNDSFKSEAFFPLNFQVIGTTTDQGYQKIESGDDGILGRFAGGVHNLPNPNEDELIDILKNIRGKRFNDSVTDDIIEETVKQLAKVRQREKIRIILDNLFYGNSPITDEVVQGRIRMLGDETLNLITISDSSSISATSAAAAAS
ncbi:MAG: ATP-binding protein [Chlamydiia bacterium]|nr:ATP-binding protein [Chlamydiia bacterium]